MDQHKNPTLSLKHFAGTHGKVWSYDKVSGRHWSASPERTCVEAHYYSFENEKGETDTRLEAAFSNIEGAAAPVYEKLASGVLPKGAERETFGCFLGLMFVRSPSMRAFATQFYKTRYEQKSRLLARDPEAFARLLKRMELDGIDVSDPELIRKRMMDLSHSNLVLPKDYVLNVKNGLEKYVTIFLNMKWSLVRAQHHFFISSDNPICRVADPKTYSPAYGDGGLLNKTAEITFPISRKRLLLLHWEAEAPREVELPRSWIMKENDKRAYFAERQFFAHIKHKELIKLCNKYRAAQSEFVDDGEGFHHVSVRKV